MTVLAGTSATVAAGEPGTGGAAGSGGAPVSSGIGYFPLTFLSGTAIVPGPAGPLYAAIGAGQPGRLGRRDEQRLARRAVELTWQIGT